jgi:hypothetical protein
VGLGEKRSAGLMSIQDDWDEIRSLWRGLEGKPLPPDEVFDNPAQRRIAKSIATEATRSPERVVKLKMSRRSESYYLLQAADAQDRAQRAHSPKDRDGWQRIADKWLDLLRRAKASREL